MVTGTTVGSHAVPELQQAPFFADRLSHQAVPNIDNVVSTATNGFAKGKNAVPRRLIYTANIGEPQQPVKKHPAKPRIVERLSPPMAAPLAARERFSIYCRIATEAKASDKANE
ncbi:hypothetical protein KBI23_22655 [bacterium]|nr:hypothetical protein [bacterium]MBP9808239.1 hypothetical protein [bacterium]